MFVRPRNIDDACEALLHAPALLLAGGTDVFPALGDGPLPPRIVDLSAVAGLAEITRTDEKVRIGAATTWTQLLRADLPPCFDGLKAAAREVGSHQIQNTGTIGGNLCNASPAADGVPPLLALDAVVELRSTGGTRTAPLAEFLQGNRRTLRRADEILAAVTVPLTAPDARSAFLKLGARRYLVISIVMVAAVVEVIDDTIRQARVAVGSCSAVAQRLPGLEAALVGQPDGGPWRDLVGAPHLEPLAPIDDVRASAAYRNEAALELVRRALDACGEA